MAVPMGTNSVKTEYLAKVSLFSSYCTTILSLATAANPFITSYEYLPPNSFIFCVERHYFQKRDISFNTLKAIISLLSMKLCIIRMYTHLQMLMSASKTLTTAVMCARTPLEGSSAGAARATNSVKMGCPVKVRM